MNGLKEISLRFEDVKQHWKYAGGDWGRHYNYWLLLYGKDAKKPAHADQCVCKHKIKENSCITDGKEFLVVGTCCIKRFTTHKGRTCEECNGPHRNRARNVFYECRENTSGNTINNNYGRMLLVCPALRRSIVNIHDGSNVLNDFRRQGVRTY